MEGTTTSDKLRILFLCSEFSPRNLWGGMETYVFSLGPALVERGHEVHLLSCAPDHEDRDYVDRGIHVHLRNRLKIPFVGRVLRAPMTIRRILNAISMHLAVGKIDTAFDVVEYPEWGAEGLLLDLRYRLPSVIQLHMPLAIVGKFYGWPDNFDYRWACSLERWAARRADFVISPSRFLIDELGAGWFGEAECEIIPNPIDWSMWQHAKPASQTDPVTLFIGRLESLKAPDVLIEAISHLREDCPQARVVFIGSRDHHKEGDPYIDRLQKLAEAVEGCEFLGVVSRDDLPGLLETARVVAVPSRFDSFPTVALEAMASGRPVVTTSATGVAEFISKHGAGHVVPPGDSRALAEALRPFLLDPAYAGMVGARAKEAAKKHFSPDRIAAKKETIYRKAIRAHSEQRSMRSVAVSI